MDACDESSDYFDECLQFDDAINKLIDGEQVKINDSVSIKGTIYMITSIPIMIKMGQDLEAENLMNLFLVYKRYNFIESLDETNLL